jgi:hypothetical protein
MTMVGVVLRRQVGVGGRRKWKSARGEECASRGESDGRQPCRVLVTYQTVQIQTVRPLGTVRVVPLRCDGRCPRACVHERNNECSVI